MKPARFSHIAAECLDEAAVVLDDSGPDARLIAGGQSLMPMLNFRLTAPALLVDLNRVTEIAGIVEGPDGTLDIGAMTRTRDIELSPTVAVAQPLLAEAVPHIAHISIRNRGTIGGSLSHADPAAEFPALAVALDAMLTLQSRTRTRELKAANFFRGVFTTAADPTEILTRIRFPAWPAGRRFAFAEFSRRRGDFALAGVVFWADVADGLSEAARVVVFGVSDRPQRIPEAERELTGHPVGDEGAIAKAAAAVRAALSPDSDIHASADFKRGLAAELLIRAVRNAGTRAVR